MTGDVVGWWWSAGPSGGLTGMTGDDGLGCFFSYRLRMALASNGLVCWSRRGAHFPRDTISTGIIFFLVVLRPKTCRRIHCSSQPRFTVEVKPKMVVFSSIKCPGDEVTKTWGHGGVAAYHEGQLQLCDCQESIFLKRSPYEVAAWWLSAGLTSIISTRKGHGERALQDAP